MALRQIVPGQQQRWFVADIDMQRPDLGRQLTAVGPQILPLEAQSALLVRKFEQPLLLLRRLLAIGLHDRRDIPRAPVQHGLGVAVTEHAQCGPVDRGVASALQYRHALASRLEQGAVLAFAVA